MYNTNTCLHTFWILKKKSLRNQDLIVIILIL